MLRRALTVFCSLALIVALANTEGVAKARVIAVFTLRSTPALAGEARTASRTIVTKLSEIEGYDAQLLTEPKSGTLGAAAAAAGAEIYVVGQLVAAEGGFKVTLGSFVAATDQSINTYTATLTNVAGLPDTPDIKALIAAAAPRQPVAPQTKVLVLLPYEGPGSTDPYALAVSQMLSGDVAAAGLAVTRIAPLDALEAVANAAKICADNGASGILIPDGRMQETAKPGFFSMTLNTHVDFRLHDVACDGTVRWSATTSGDDTTTGMVPNFSGSVNAAYKTAVQRAAAARSTAVIASVPAATIVPESAAPSQGVSTYLLLPFDVLGMANQRKVDMTTALLTRLQTHKLNVRSGTSIDPFSAVARAQQLCASSDTQAIIVPMVRMEVNEAIGAHSTPHASFSLTLLGCDGRVIRHALAQGDYKPAMLFFSDPDGAVAAATDAASEKAIAQLFPT
jgi:hypothetical protein